eukprot:13842655-Heterocapsa_arctica.AAC.1
MDPLTDGWTDWRRWVGASVAESCGEALEDKEKRRERKNAKMERRKAKMENKRAKKEKEGLDTT